MKYFFPFIILFFSFQFSLAQEDRLFKDYYDSGELMIEGQYINKKRVGEWKRYHKNGEISSLFSYNNGKLNKQSSYFYEDGTISHKTQKENGIYIRRSYYESGKLQSKSEDQNGYYKGFLENGSLEIEANYKDNELSGEWKRYYENGSKEWIVNYKGGYRDGVYQQFYKNGDLKLDGVIENDKKEGEEKRYLPNMNLEWKGDYNKDRLHNTWTKFNTKGKKVEKIKYFYGSVSNSKTDTRVVVIEVPDGVIERVAVYPGCENVYGNKARKNCMNQNVNKLIGENFNTHLGTNIGLSGKQRIFVIFKVDKTGNVIDINAKAPHPNLKAEAERVIGLLPKFKPAKQYGKPVTMPFSVPIVFVVK